MLMGGIAVEYPAYPHLKSRSATAYIRPHELEIDRVPIDSTSLPARILQIHPAGAVTKIRLHAETSHSELNAEINRERCAELGLKPGDTVHIAPRQFHVFMEEDYAI
jgi:sulfate/thiosulfate transport system ATP-binding protein